MQGLFVPSRKIGCQFELWSSVIKELEEAEELTKKNKTLTLNMCVNYGGRSEIVDAATALARDVKRGKVKPDSITEKDQNSIYHNHFINDFTEMNEILSKMKFLN